MNLPRSVLMVLLGAGLSWAAAPRTNDVVLAFAVRQYLGPFVGKWDPAHRWTQATDFYAPPEQQTPVTLYRLGETPLRVVVTDRQASNPHGVPADWYATVSRWPWEAAPYALAVIGGRELRSAPARAHALPDAALESAVAGYLKAKGLRVEHPLLTEAYDVELAPGDTRTFLCAHSDEQALRDEEEAFEYAVALVQQRDGTLEPVASQTYFKPAGRTLDEHRHLHGTRDFYRWVAAADVDGDGRAEAALYTAKSDATQVDLISLDGAAVKKRLTSFRAYR